MRRSVKTAIKAGEFGNTQLIDDSAIDWKIIEDWLQEYPSYSFRYSEFPKLITIIYYIPDMKVVKRYDEFDYEGHRKSTEGTYEDIRSFYTLGKDYFAQKECTLVSPISYLKSIAISSTSFQRTDRTGKIIELFPYEVVDFLYNHSNEKV